MGQSMLQIRRGVHGSSVVLPVEHLCSSAQLSVSSCASEWDLLDSLAVAGLVS